MKQSYRTLICILTTVMLVFTPLSVLSHQALGEPFTSVSITVKSVNLAGNNISGLWTTIQSGSTVLKTGYTPLTFTIHANNQYKVTVANYRNYVFEHWLNGDTNSIRTITPTRDTTIIAYYSTGGKPVSVLQPPKNLYANPVSLSQINLSWTAPASNGGSAITGYKIGRSTDGGFTWSPIDSNTGTTATTYSDTGLSSKTAYTYRVFAINSVGSSSPSNTASAITGLTTGGHTMRISTFTPGPSGLMSVIKNHLNSNDVTISFRAIVVNTYPVQNRALLAESFNAINQAVKTANYNPKSITHIGYDNEASNGNLSTPPGEIVDPALSTNKAADMVHKAGYKFAATPTRAILLKEYQGVQWSKVDMLVMQLQKITNQPSLFKSTATAVANFVQLKNPNTLVYVQVNPALDTISNIASDINGIRNSIDGVSIVCETSQHCTPLMLEKLLVALGR